MKLQERKALLKKELPKLKGNYYCPALDAFVTVNNDSINEIIFWAVLNDKSTKLALNINHLLTNETAEVLLKDSNIKTGKQTKKFNLKEIFILKSKINIGTAKLTIGVKKSGKHIQYCVTNFYK